MPDATAAVAATIWLPMTAAVGEPGDLGDAQRRLTYWADTIEPQIPSMSPAPSPASRSAAMQASRTNEPAVPPWLSRE
jgi:hypothetical protein